MSKKKSDAAVDIHPDEVAPAVTDTEPNDAPPAASVELVRMTRDGKAADVHPDEVANYAAFGWQKA